MTGIDSMLLTRALVGLLAIITLGGVAILWYQMERLTKTIVQLHHDFMVVRLDHLRTLSEIKKRNKK